MTGKKERERDGNERAERKREIMCGVTCRVCHVARGGPHEGEQDKHRVPQPWHNDGDLAARDPRHPERLAQELPPGMIAGDRTAAP